MEQCSVPAVTWDESSQRNWAGAEAHPAFCMQEGVPEVGLETFHVPNRSCPKLQMLLLKIWN